IVINYVVDHAPKPEILFNLAGTNNLQISFEGHDPENDPLSVTWKSDDTINPEALNINTKDELVTLPIPQTPGEYFVDLVAIDPDSNQGITRNYFSIGQNGNLSFPTVNSNPDWVKEAIIYEIFLPAFTAEGTLAAARKRLPTIKSLGVNVIWLMPIYENSKMITELNAGYNITDFFKVHPQLGTIADFQAFLAEAHNLDMRVILDSTPNHVSGNDIEPHPWIKDILLFRDFSNFRPFIEDRLLGDHRGLGQFLKKFENYNLYSHYSNWQLANLNYSNIETRDYMLNMYKYWVLDQGIDGYRMDVYWGPQNRYGKTTWWRPFREAMKRVRPDILILGETDGTGIGSENNYADGGGACDTAYDWNFYNEIKSTFNGGSIDNLDNRVRNFSPNLNYNHFTGANAHYFRFLENHDETRITQLVGGLKSRAGAALLFTIPGIPMIYAGQEVGETSRRGKINWNRPEAESTFDFYQRLVTIRNTFPTFRSSEIKRVASSHSRVYAFLRPQLDQNGLATINFSNNKITASLTINESDLRVSTDSLLAGVTYFMNDVLNDTSYAVTKSAFNNFQFELLPWKGAVFILADSVITLVTSVNEPEIVTKPGQFHLWQNYPNPFNPSTFIRFEVVESAPVILEIYNILGRKIRTLLNENKLAGEYTVQWDGKNDVGADMASGVYIMRLTAGNFVNSIKMVKLK
ncbi:MAG: alpha-amylase family glycosyl hydrolase, partial [bacterium]